MRQLPLALLSLALAPTLLAEGDVAQVFDEQIKNLENTVVPLAEAMPAGKYDFAPTQGSFNGVRTFAEQIRHFATVIYLLSGAVTAQKPPVDVGKDDSGPASVRTKAQLVEYLRGSLAFAHRAAQTLSQSNLWDEIPSPLGDNKTTRFAAMSMITWHSNDHYGQMVVYARMNGVIPPSSQPSPPAKQK